MGMIERKKAILLNEPHLSTASGTIANFKTDMSAPLKECKITFTPNQSGTGDPSPTNVRPISGYTGLNLVHCGKNLWSSDWELGGIKADGSITSDTDRVRSSGHVRVIPGCVYSITRNIGDGYNQVRAYGDDKSFVRGGSSAFTFISGDTGDSSNPIRGYGLYCTIQNKDDQYHWRFADLTTNIPAQLKYMMVAGSIPETEYEPYNGNEFTITFPSSAGTIYGGYVDLVRGVVVETWHKELLKNMAVTKYSDSLTAWHNYHLIPSSTYAITIDEPTTGLYCISDTFVGTPQTGGILTKDQTLSIVWTSIVNGTLRIKTQDYCNLTAREFRSTFGDTAFVYKLKTPIEHPLDSIPSLKSLKGTNNIYTNANGTVEVKYWTH